MKHEVTTLNTKKTLSASLKKFMEIKPLSKITVSDIISDCGVNRKTFYYHFEDIYDLLKWTLDREAVDVVKQFDLLSDYKKAIMFAMEYVENNKHILNCAFDTMGRDELKRFFYNEFYCAVDLIVSACEKSYNKYIRTDYRKFAIDFLIEGLAGILVSTFRDKEHLDKEKTADYISQFFLSALPVVVMKADEKVE